MNIESPASERFALKAPRTFAELGLGGAGAAADFVVTGVGRFGTAATGEVCFCDREPGEDLREIAPGALTLCPPELEAVLRRRFPGERFLPLPDPRSTFIDLGERLLAAGEVEVSSLLPRPFGTHPSARIGVQSWVHPEARVEQDVVIGAGCIIHRGSWIRAGAVIRDNTVVGVEGINAYRGADGRQRRFPHFAGVVIGEEAEVGAGAVVVRGILNSTRIGRGSVVGNLCNIGHVVEIGEKVWMSVGCLIGGHTRIGVGATLGMGVTVKDNVDIGARAQVGMGAVVTKSVDEKASVFGNPARVVGPIQAGPER